MIRETLLQKLAQAEIERPKQLFINGKKYINSANHTHDISY